MRFSRSSKWVDKRWYLSVRCRKCRAPIFFGIDHTEGRGPVELPGKLLLTCSECGHRGDYSKARVSKGQKSA
jgi:RNase P subunit RPR2